ncbi:uncharacterized protein VTP21DRAFT_2710 [Calcarisporiella thermophila]|uniref:uncharacterized protein n=1 Tax=Calcarisporiella thermophila TaxID=911321 RepID=UPI003744AC66
MLPKKNLTRNNYYDQFNTLRPIFATFPVSSISTHHGLSQAGADVANDGLFSCGSVTIALVLKSTKLSIDYLVGGQVVRQGYFSSLFACAGRSFLRRRKNATAFVLNLYFFLDTRLAWFIWPNSWTHWIKERDFRGHWIQKSGEKADIAILYAHGRVAAVPILNKTPHINVYIGLGGGFIYGHDLMWMPSFVAWIQQIKKETGKNAAILSLEYRKCFGVGNLSLFSVLRVYPYFLALAPKRIYPTQQLEYLAAYDYLLHQKQIPADKLIFAGDDAGGNLALCSALKLHFNLEHELENATPLPAALFLISPWVNMAHVSRSMYQNFGYDYLYPPSLNQWRDTYLPKGYSYLDTDASPLHAASFKGLPPTLLAFGGLEVFHDDLVMLARRLRDSRVGVDVWLEEKGIHDFCLLMRRDVHRGAEKLTKFIKEYVGL